MSEIWKIWHPVKYRGPKLELFCLIDTHEGLELTFSHYKNTRLKIVVSFMAPVLSYRNTDEANRIKSLDYLSNTHGKELIKELFFIVKNSEYARWLVEENGGIYGGIKDITHYAFVTSEEIVEVLSLNPPKVSMKYEE